MKRIARRLRQGLEALAQKPGHRIRVAMRNAQLVGASIRRLRDALICRRQCASLLRTASSDPFMARPPSTRRTTRFMKLAGEIR